jgi:hypothetical protein
MKYIIRIFSIIVISTGYLSAQVPTVQDCMGAIPICQNTYSTINSYVGVGNYDEIGYFGNTCLAGENNTVWYIFTAQTSGFLCFVITPNNMADDYDWGVWDLTTATCADIMDNTINPLSCNSWGSLSGYNGLTGASTAQGGTDNNNGPGETNGPPWNSDIPVVAGGTYVLMVDNWTGSSYGYTINFSTSTAVIFDNVDPFIDQITSTITCGTTNITFKFSENVLCSTVSNTDFTLTGPGGPYTISSVSGAACALGGNQEMTYSIVFSPAISTNGSYHLNLVGSVTDLCGNEAPPDSLNFQVTSIPGAPTVSCNSPVCTNDTLFLSAQSLTGATFQWTGPAGFSSTQQNPVLLNFSTANAGIYSVIATVNGCTSPSSSVTVSVQQSSIYVNLGPDTTICSDATILLDASNNGGNTAATYSWHNSLNGNVFTTPTFLADKPATYWVSVTDYCGTDVDSITVTYNEMGLDIGIDLFDLCSSNPLTIDATTPLAGYPSVTYLWSSGEMTPTITVSTSGTYTVSVTRGYCTEVDTKTVTFVNPVTVNLGNDVSICTGTSTILNAGYFPGAAYLWSTGLNTQSIMVTNAGNYSVTVTNSCGSSNDNVNVAIVSSPVVNLGNDVTICNGQVQYLDATTAGGSYHWSTGANSPAIAVTNAGNYFVTVTTQCGTAEDNIIVTVDYPLNLNLGNDSTVCPGYQLNPGCSDCSYFWSTGQTTQSITITQSDGYSVEVTNMCGTYSDFVNLQVIQLNVDLGNDTTICPGSDIILDALNPGLTYLWSSGETLQSIYVSTTGTYTVSVTNQCGTKTDSITVTVFDPLLNLGNDTAICNGSTITLDAGHPGSTYHWSNGSTTQTIEVDSENTYSVTVTSICGTVTDNINISVLSAPFVELGADTFFIDPGQTVTLNAGPGFAAYHWSTGASTQTITVGTQGYYSVTVTGFNGCHGYDHTFVKVWTGIDESVQDNDISVYPNPASDLITVSGKIEISSVELFNVLGKLVKSVKSVSNPIQLDTSGLNKGLYLLRIMTSQNDYLIRQVEIVK